MALTVDDQTDLVDPTSVGKIPSLTVTSQFEITALCLSETDTSIVRRIV